MKKRILSALLVLSVMLNFIPAMSFAASAEEASGGCGDGIYRDPNDLKWSYNNGTLTISGVGPMANYNEPEDAPWYDLREAITKVTVNGKSDVDDELVTIGDYAFFSVYPKLSAVEIGQNVSTIGKHSFDDCAALTNLTLSEGVREIDTAAFQYCDSLSKVIIPASIWIINTNAFRGCAALRSVTIMPDSKNEAEIRRSAFAGCSSLETVILGGNVSLEAPNIFADCPALKTVIIEIVSEISSNIFGVSSLNLPSLIFTADPPESIEDDAFEGVTANAYYPADNVRWTEAVRQNYGGELTWIPITEQGICSKTEADKVNWLLLNDGTMLIYGTGEMTDWDSEKDTPWYSHCSEIKKLSISGNIKNIGKNAFSGCSELEEVFALPATLKTIGFKSFRKCTALKSFDIPDSVTKLEAETFFGCTSLESVTSNDNVKQINYNTFNGCEKLKNAPIGNNVTAIGDNAFNGCISLTSVTFPNGLKSLSYNAFIGCTGLTKITIPASVTSVGKTAFRNCSAIQSVTMEGNVETIGENAFEGCDMLNRVIFYGNTPPTIDPAAFTNVTATVFYPKFNAIWTAEGVRQNYGGSLTWVATICSSFVHDYDALYLVKEATETEPAEYHAVCTCCGDITDSYIPKTAWQSATLTIIQEGVLLERGATFKHNYGSTMPLSECDVYVNGSVVATIKNGKSWTAPECLLCTKINRGVSSSRIYFVSACDFTEATCTEPATCVYCGEADVEAPGHTWEGATCTDPDVCTVCGAIGEALGHDFTSPGTLISAADCTHAAVYTAKCVRCEEINGTLQVGSTLGHKYELIKKLSDSPLTYTAECLVCGEYNEAYEVPDKYYSVTDKVTTASMQVGRTVKPNSVITLDATSKMLKRKITVYIDGIKVYEGENDYTTPNQCLKCVQKSGTTLRFETDCLFIRVNCENPKTCVYCGHTVGSALGHTFEKGKCTRCGFVQDEFLFDSVSLVLSGELGLNFYTVVNDSEAVKDGYMLFEIDNKGVTQTVYFTDAVLVDGRYVFRCNVNALQMSDTITVSFHYGDVTVGPRTTSVAGYIDKVIENHSNDDNHPTVKLAKSILNYGHYAQIALSELHGFTLGTDYTETDNKNNVTIANATDLEAYKATKTGNIDGITKVSRSLSLDHGTDINLYLTVAEDYEPTVNVTDKNENMVNYTLEKQTDGRYLLVIPQIAAHELGDMYTVSVDGGAMTINVSALSYAYSVLNSEKSDAQKLCVFALYEYYTAAIAYRNAQ